MDANQPKRRRSDEPTREMSMEQTCMVCLRSFWSSREICGCPANYCSALVCSHCAVRSHEIGVVVKSERYTHVHWCVGCRRHRSKPDGGVPVVDVTRPRGGIHLRELAKRGIRTWSCGYGLYEWGSSQGEVFDNEDDCHAHMLVCGTKEVSRPAPIAPVPCPPAEPRPNPVEQVNCQYCGLAGTKKSLFETHMKFCHRKHYITPCTSCGLLQDARDMDGVHSYVCARGTTSCIVCGDEGAHTEPREDMMDHIERAHPVGPRNARARGQVEIAR